MLFKNLMSIFKFKLKFIINNYCYRQKNTLGMHYKRIGKHALLYLLIV